MCRYYYDPYSGKRKSQRYYTNRKRNMRNQKLVRNDVFNWFGPSGFWWSDSYWDASWNRLPEENAYIKRYWRKHSSKPLKVSCSRLTRRRLKTVRLQKGNAYRKVTDFWWEYW